MQDQQNTDERARIAAQQAQEWREARDRAEARKIEASFYAQGETRATVREIISAKSRN